MVAQGWTIAQVARALEVSEKTVRRRVERGELPAFRLHRGRGYEWRIDPAGLGLATEAIGASSAVGPADGPATGEPSDSGDRALVVQPLLDLIREKDQQIVELANQLGIWQERAHQLESLLRERDGEADLGEADSEGLEPDRSWWRRLMG
jgi:excisionase family DNA binding protein